MTEQRTQTGKTLYEQAVEEINKENYAEAFALFQKSAEQEEASRGYALWYLGGMLYEPKYGMQDLVQAFNYYEKARQTLNSEGKTDEKLEKFFNNLIQNMTQAAYSAIKDKDYEKGETYNKAIQNYEPAALNNLGWLYSDFPDYTGHDLAKGFEYFKQAAEKGYIWAYRNLANCYSNGKGTPVNFEKALQYAEMSIQQKAGNSEYSKPILLNCCRELGKQYRNAEKYDDAEEFFRKALQYDADDSECLMGLSSMYLDKKWNKHSVRKSFDLLTDRYDKTDNQALKDKIATELSNRYKNGVGIPKDELRAKYWQQQLPLNELLHDLDVDKLQRQDEGLYAYMVVELLSQSPSDINTLRLTEERAKGENTVQNLSWAKMNAERFIYPNGDYWSPKVEKAYEIFAQHADDYLRKENYRQAFEEYSFAARYHAEAEEFDVLKMPSLRSIYNIAVMYYFGIGAIQDKNKGLFILNEIASKVTENNRNRIVINIVRALKYVLLYHERLLARELTYDEIVSNIWKEMDTYALERNGFPNLKTAVKGIEDHYNSSKLRLGLTTGKEQFIKEVISDPDSLFILDNTKQEDPEVITAAYNKLISKGAGEYLNAANELRNEYDQYVNAFRTSGISFVRNNEYYAIAEKAYRNKKGIQFKDYSEGWLAEAKSRLLKRQHKLSADYRDICLYAKHFELTADGEKIRQAINNERYALLKIKDLLDDVDAAIKLNDKDFRGMKRGKDGEDEVARFVRDNNTSNWVILEDVNLPRYGNPERNFENDIIIVNTRGVYTLEVKNYQQGIISITEAEDISNVNAKGNPRGEIEDNVLKQSQMHTLEITKLLNNELGDMGYNFENFVHSIIVVPNNTLAIDNKCPYVTSDKLNVLRNAILSSGSEVFSKDDVAKITEYLRNKEQSALRFEHTFYDLPELKTLSI